MGLQLLQTGDHLPKNMSEEPASATERKRGHRILLEPLARPTGEGNARIRITSGETRTLSLDLDRLCEDQKRYLEDLRKAKRVVTVKGRQKKTRDDVPKPPKHSGLKLKPGQEEELFPFCGLPELDPEEEQLLIKNCLMITDLKVVEDPERTTGTGAWTFGTLMANVANRGATGIEPAELVRQWLETWKGDRGDSLKKLILGPWQERSGGNGKPLDLTIAPFRLMAIVNRVDLRGNLVLGNERIGGGGAGEARFVFCAYDIDAPDGMPLQFTVIFEYQIKRKNFHDVREWAEQWYALKNIPLGTTRYNKALQKITNQLAGAGIDIESPPNQSALSQLRTNEVALAEQILRRAPPGQAPKAFWELREFRIDVNNSGYLRQVTVKQTPDLIFNEGTVTYVSTIGLLGVADVRGPLLPTSVLFSAVTPALAHYVNGAEADILAHEHHVPAKILPGYGFLGAAALTPSSTFWNDQNIRNPEVRHLFSLGTCNGCHAREAFPQKDVQFTHVHPRKSGEEAALSPFLTGRIDNGDAYVLDDPAGQKDARGLVKRPFNELSNRAHDLAGLVEYGVIYEKERRPIRMVH
jgi:hypothetical protein